MRQNYGEVINRPYGGMVVIVHVRDIEPRVPLARWRNAVEMRMNRRGMVMIGPDTSVNVLKRRHKKCQQECEASR
jgi:hypothetical protein